MKKILLPMVVLAASGAYVWSQQDRLNAETGFGLDTTLDASSGSVPGPLPAADDAPAATAPTPAIDTEPAPVVPALLLRPATDTTVAQATVTEPDPASLLVAIGTSPSAPLPLPRPAPSVATPARAGVLLAAATGAIATSPYKDGNYKGSAANAYYGLVQVQAQIQSGQLVHVEVLQYPSDRRTSRKINARALPTLQREAIQAQSSRIDYISGATLSSAAFAKSLSSALSQAL